MMKDGGYIFSIKRFAIHDGPGIRTTVFLSGCPMRCPWCQNPEGLAGPDTIFWDSSKCVGCRHCQEVDENNCLSFANGRVVIVKDRASLISRAIEECPAGALRANNEWKSVDEVMDTVLRDRVYYENSGGGLTISGGEPFYQMDFALAILKSAHGIGIRTACETSLAFPNARICEVFPYVDSWMFDLKIFDEETHRRILGAPNSIILENIRYITDRTDDALLRIPLIPGYTSTHENLVAIADFASGLRKVKVELLNFNILASSKYTERSMDFMFMGTQPLTKEEIEESRSIFTLRGVDLVTV